MCFYAILIGFFAGLLAVFYQTLDNKMPKWQLANGLIGANPGKWLWWKLTHEPNQKFDIFFYIIGLGFRPMPPESNVESTLIWFKHSDAKNTKYWVDQLNTFLQRTIFLNFFHVLNDIFID